MSKRKSVTVADSSKVKIAAKTPCLYSSPDEDKDIDWKKCFWVKTIQLKVSKPQLVPDQLIHNSHIMIWQNTSFNSKKSICYQCHQNQKIKFTESSNFVKSAKICETLCCEKNYPKYPKKLSLCEQFEESAWSAISRFLKWTVDQIVKSSILAHV